MTSIPKQKLPASLAPQRLGPLDVLILSAWCGLAAGELEVVTRFLYRNLSATNRLYMMTRHFVWTAPLVSLLMFLGMGVFLAAATRFWPGRAGWLSPRLIASLAVLSIALVAGPQVYPEAWLILALGAATLFSPVLERHAAGVRRWLLLSLPVLLGIVLVQAGLIFGGDRLKQWREERRPLPPSGSPNVLLVVLDTVRADRLSVYGYERPTSPTLERLATRGIRFDQARAAAPWTLASHATLFTGRWPHDLNIHWMTPLRRDFLTLAEFLGARGYATAGFVGNTFYCSYDSGLDRGFTHYEDYLLERSDALRTVHLVDFSLKTLTSIVPAMGRSLPMGSTVASQGLFLRQFSHGERKNAGVVNGEFLRWLSHRREQGRPFFAFLNYADAHAPYVLPPAAVYRFGSVPRTEADFMFLLESWLRVDKLQIPQQGRTLARDSYDNCLAYLDERLGELFEELERQGVLDHTVVIVTADHGEGLGEHNLFDHGESLYRTEIRVPLLFVLPSDGRSPAVVKDCVSLRDIPATVADLVGSATTSPFPGRSLTRLWRETPAPLAAPADGDTVLSELSAPNPSDPNQGRSPAYRGPLISLAAGDYIYIRNQRDGSEELFNERDDPHELVNRARVDAMLPVLQGFRNRLDQIKTDALTEIGITGQRRLTLESRSQSDINAEISLAPVPFKTRKIGVAE
jgi:arylsulfatase A-like enzyme